jgi:PPOX class probable F420-dependent enzyme
MSFIDTSTAFGGRAEQRLRDERIAWLTTVRRDGTPQPTPVWYLWDGDGFLLYSQPGTQKLRNIAANPHVTLHLDGDGRGGNVVVVTGDAAVDDSAPPASAVPEYLERYGPFIERNGWTPESFSADYSVPIRVRATRLRGH